MKHASWGPQDNAEFDALMQAVVSEATGTGDRLLALADLVPGATSPAEACERLGITVKSWLAEAVAS